MSIETISSFDLLPKTSTYELDLREESSDQIQRWIQYSFCYPNPLCIKAKANSRLIPFLLKFGTIPELKLYGDRDFLTNYEKEQIKTIHSNKVSFNIVEPNIDPGWFGFNTPHLKIIVFAYCPYNLHQLLIKIPPNERPTFLDLDDDECDLHAPGILKIFPNIQTLRTSTVDIVEDYEKIPRLIAVMPLLSYRVLLALYKKIDEERDLDINVRNWDEDIDTSDVKELVPCNSKGPFTNYRVRFFDGDVLMYTIVSGNYQTLLDII